MGLRWDGAERRKGERRGAGRLQGTDLIRATMPPRDFGEQIAGDSKLARKVISESEARVMDGNR